MNREPAPLAVETFERFRRLIHERTGIWMREGKQILVSNRLRRRLSALGLASYEAYLDLVEGGGETEEIAHFIDAVSTNETYFFREVSHFAALRAMVLPRLLAGGRTVRIWSAGCSSGEEVYTLRIVADEVEAASGGTVEIVGTDINTSVIAAAREGVYRERALRFVPPTALARWFTDEGPASWRVKDDLRRRVSFRVHHLLQDPPPEGAPFEVIFCRNVMIYFDKQTQRRLVDGRFAAAIRPEGWLFIGHAESLTSTSERFQYRPLVLDPAALPAGSAVAAACAGSERARAPVYRPVPAAAGVRP